MNSNEILINETSSSNFKSSFQESFLDRNSNFTQVKFLASDKRSLKRFNSISFKSSQFLFSILSYKLNPELLSGFIEEIIEKTQESHPKAKFKITKNKKLELKLSKPLTNRFSLKTQNLEFFLKKSSKLVSSSKIFEDFSITRCLADLKSAKSFYLNHDRQVFFSIFKEFQRRRVPNLIKQGSLIKYEEINKDSSSTRVIQVEVSLIKSSLNLKFKPLIRLPTLMSELDPLDYFNSEECKECLKKINRKILIGTFFVEGKNLVYQSKYLVSDITKINMSTHLLIKKDVDLIFYYLPFFEETISECSTQAETLQVKYKDPGISLNQAFAVKEVKMIPEEYEREKRIKEILGTTSQDLFLANRLLHRKIVFLADFIVQYPISLQGEKFESFAHEFPREAIDSIFYLTDELLKLNLKFKSDRFPLNSFLWYEEKPIYTYDFPLFQLLEFNQKSDLKKKAKNNSENSESEDSDSFEEVSDLKKTFFFDILDFHSLSLNLKTQFFSPSEVFTAYETVEFIQLEESVARERIAIFEANNLAGVVKYRGICKSGQNIFLLSEKKGLNSIFFQLEKFSFDFQFLVKFSKDLLKIVEIITLKNTCFACFDPKCLFFKENGKIRIEIKTPAEVSEEFQPPEVKSGRFFRFSIVFSYAKVVEFAFCYFFCVSRGMLPEAENLLAAKSFVYQEFQWFGEMVRGCCEDKIVRRWNVSKLIQYFSTHLGND